MSVEIYSRFHRPKSEQMTFDDLPSMTEQHHKDDCDINVIAARLERGIAPAVSGSTPFYADLTEFPSEYADVALQLRTAQTWFNCLPSELRHRFGNDPGSIIKFMEDPANYDECVKLGVLPPKPQVNPEDIPDLDETPGGSVAEQP